MTQPGIREVAPLDQAIANLQAEGGKIVIKQGWFWMTIHYLVILFTFGTNRRFISDYFTTIGPWVGVTKDWRLGDESHIRNVVLATVIEHEKIHIQQCKKFGLGNVYLGLPLFTLFYLLLPLPIGFAYFRWRFERAAYTHGINYRIKHQPHNRTRLIEDATIELSSGNYGWTWPFPKRVRAYFEEHVDASTTK